MTAFLAATRRVAFLMAILVAGAMSRPAASADVQGAQAFINQLGNQAITVLEEGAGNTAEIAPAFRDLFRAGFDVPTIGRFVLGRYWNAATEDQRREYLSLYEAMIVQTYARRFSEYSGETLSVTGARPEGETDVLVNSQIVRPNGPPVAVSWRVRDRGQGTFQIVDVMVENVSMGVTQRSEFSAIIQRSGGDVGALLTALRNQTGA